MADTAGTATLVKTGWFFEIDDSVNLTNKVEHSWVYWNLSDFSKIERHALKNAIANIVLVVIVEVFNVPVFVPALSLSLGDPFNMNHEFIGQGAANILAGMTGTVPVS